MRVQGNAKNSVTITETVDMDFSIHIVCFTKLGSRCEVVRVIRNKFSSGFHTSFSLELGVVIASQQNVSY